MELAELQLQFPAPPEESVALAWHWMKALGAAAHGTSPRRERADSCPGLRCSPGIQDRSRPNPCRKQLHPSAPCPRCDWGKQVALRAFEAFHREGFVTRKLKTFFPLEMNLV